MKTQKGFTLIEMLVVLMIISTLILITIPNIAKNNKLVEDKGCEALRELAEAQVQAYKIEYHNFPDTIDTLVTEGYLKQDTCPGGEPLVLQEDGTVIVTTVTTTSAP